MGLLEKSFLVWNICNCSAGEEFFDLIKWFSLHRRVRGREKAKEWKKRIWSTPWKKAKKPTEKNIFIIISTSRSCVENVWDPQSSVLTGCKIYIVSFWILPISSNDKEYPLTEYSRRAERFLFISCTFFSSSDAPVEMNIWKKRRYQICSTQFPLPLDEGMKTKVFYRVLFSSLRSW